MSHTILRPCIVKVSVLGYFPLMHTIIKFKENKLLPISDSSEKHRIYNISILIKIIISNPVRIRFYEITYYFKIFS